METERRVEIALEGRGVRLPIGHLVPALEPVAGVAQLLAEALALGAEELVPGGVGEADDGITGPAHDAAAKRARPGAIPSDLVADEDVVPIGLEAATKRPFRGLDVVLGADRPEAIAVPVADQPQDPKRPL